MRSMRKSMSIYLFQ